MTARRVSEASSGDRSGSGHGKTTVATGLIGALMATGLKVAGFKVGPDYIDPGYHTLATGRVGRNLDPFLCGEEQMAPLLLHGAQTPEPADIAIIEGVMGLFDGQITPRVPRPRSCTVSTPTTLTSG